MDPEGARRPRPGDGACGSAAPANCSNHSFEAAASAGLGLSIAQRAVLGGGEMLTENRAKGGLVAKITLPAVEPVVAA